jgi:hypothetical protein
VDLGVADGVNIASVDASANTGAFTAEFDASLVPLTVTGPTLAHILNVNTGAGADTVIGSAANDVIDLNNGNDTASGNAGNDTINGNNGADTINGNAGNDTLNGGAGNDTINSGAGTDGVDGGTGADAFTGGTGVETYAQVLTGSSVAPTAKTTADAGAFAAGDTLTFGNGVDVITGFSTTTGSGATAASDDILNANSTGAALPTTLIGVAENDLTAAAGGVNMIVSGAWDAASSTFTMTSDDLGPDSLFLSALHTGGGHASDDIMTNTNIVILVGAGTEDLVAAQFS